MVRGPVKLFKDQLLMPESKGSVLQHVAEFKEKLWSACAIAPEQLAKAQVNPLTPDAGRGKTKRLVKTVKEATQSSPPPACLPACGEGEEDWVASLTVFTSLFVFPVVWHEVS